MSEEIVPASSLAEGLAWLRYIESLSEEEARRQLRSRLRADAGDARANLRLLEPWPSMPAGAHEMFRRDGELVRLRWIVDVVPTGARILDVGCGPGVVGGTLALHGRPDAYLGIDLSEPKIESAREMASVNGLGRHLSFQVGDAAELPVGTIADLAPDTVLILEVLEHLHDPVGVLSSIAELVPDDATVMFSVPILGRIEACWGHRTLYGADAILGLTDESGLRLLNVSELHNTWALATATKGKASPDAPTGTTPITVQHLSPSEIRSDRETATRLMRPPRLVLALDANEIARLDAKTPDADWIRLDVEVLPPTALRHLEIITSDENGSELRRWTPDVGRLSASGRRTLIARPQEVSTPSTEGTASHTSILLTSGPERSEVTIWRLGFARGYERLLPPSDSAPTARDEQPSAFEAQPVHAAAPLGPVDKGPIHRIADAAEDVARTTVRRWPWLRQPAAAMRDRARSLHQRWGR